MIFKIIQLVFVNLLLLSCTLVGQGETCQTAGESMVNLTRGLEIPDRLLKKNPTRSEDDFDANTYFSALDHLSMESGYTLDYVYEYYALGGEPFVYARPLDQLPYTSYAEYMDVTGAEYQGPLSEHTTDYLAHVQIDDTEAGYLQYVLLHIMGGQFYLFWHSNYDDRIVICDQHGLKAALAAADYSKLVPQEIKEEAERIDFQPVVDLTEGLAIVRVVTFTKWGGFEERVYSISREFPHKVVNLEVETLVEYDCGLYY